MSATPQATQAAVVRLAPTARERIGGAAATLAIMAIVAGVPAGLLAVFGSPLPADWPSSDALTAPISTEALLGAVAFLVWLAWLHFVICLVVEAVSALRARGVPHPVPLGAASQPVARRLVAAALLLIAATGVLTRGHADGPRRSAVDGATSFVAGAPVEDRLAAAEHAAQLARDRTPNAAEVIAPALDDPVAYDGEFPPGTKIYTVQPPKGRYHDNLWDIAERHLGDGRRYREIFDLNKDREQPFGGRLQLARLIHPGWLLVMPADAVGVDVVLAPPRQPAGLANAAVTPEGGPQHRAVAEPAVDTAEPVADRGMAGHELLAAGLLAAGLLSGLSALRELQRRRRAPGAVLPRPDSDAAEVEVTLRLAADPDGSDLLDRALRALAGLCAGAGRAVPDVFAVRLSPRRIELLLSPPAAEPPAPFLAEDGGRCWAIDRDAVPSSPPGDEDGGRPPLPGLVGIGRDVDDEGTHVLIDLEAAAGPVAVSGERALVMEFLTAAAAELATNGWSGRVAVTCVGLDVGLVDLAPDRVQVAADLDEVLAAFERRHLSDPEPGTDAVLTGRLGGRRGDLFVSDYLIVARPPTPTQAERLRRLAGRGDLAGVGVLVAGPVAGARWRLEVADTARLPLLGLEVVPQRLTGQTLQRLVALAKTADLEPRPPSTTLTQPHGPEPQTVHLRSVGPAPAVEVRILGPLEIAGVALDEARRSARTEEIVTFLALHPDAVTRADLVAALWPGGATDESVMAALQRTTRWLGRDRHTGQALLEGGDEGPWRLASSVRLDWDLFQSLVVRGGHDDLREALRLVRGGLLAGRPHGRYAWLARMAIEYDAPVLIADTAHRVARVALLRHEVGPAAAAARTGLSVDRDAVALWRDLLDAESRRDPAAARRVADAMRERFGHRLDPATRAALASALGEAASVASTS